MNDYSFIEPLVASEERTLPGDLIHFDFIVYGFFMIESIENATSFSINSKLIFLVHLI